MITRASRQLLLEVIDDVLAAERRLLRLTGAASQPRPRARSRRQARPATSEERRRSDACRRVRAVERAVGLRRRGAALPGARGRDSNGTASGMSSRYRAIRIDCAIITALKSRRGGLLPSAPGAWWSRRAAKSLGPSVTVRAAASRGSVEDGSDGPDEEGPRTTRRSGRREWSRRAGRGCESSRGRDPAPGAASSAPVLVLRDW